MRYVVLIHTDTEGPGTLGDFLRATGAQVDLALLYRGDPVPQMGTFDALISMGGTMNVYDEDEFPFLRAETDLLSECILKGTPVLGVCLGAQMAAKAGGAKVVRSPHEEIGWGTVDLSPEGVSDPLFEGIPATFDVFQYHGDMFHIPAEGKALASSALCPHQALRVGNAWGLQFHVEVTAEMISAWFGGNADGERFVRELAEKQAVLDSVAQRIFRNFEGIVKGLKT